MSITLYNTLSRSHEVFVPRDSTRVRMYVCGPTVYDYAHIGNARPVIVFDMLFRLLKDFYGEKAVLYARNITDVDDKINARAARDFPGMDLNEAISRLTRMTEARFKEDVAALSCLEPTYQPRATDNIVQMIEIVQRLISRGHAYVAGNEVLFSVPSMADYGQLSGRDVGTQRGGARIAVAGHKKSNSDFVLWKGSADNEPSWDSPWGRGRPGWHIECSAMSSRYLGETFDIHGGGHDLIFPHHENEIAQSRCAHGTDVMAHYWMHNGFVMLDGRKMAKSEGNFVTVHELLRTENYGGRSWSGDVLRLAMLMTSYREPLDFTQRRLLQAESLISSWPLVENTSSGPDREVVDLLSNDLDTVGAINALNSLAQRSRKNEGSLEAFSASARFMGVGRKAPVLSREVIEMVEDVIAERQSSIEALDWPRADALRAKMSGLGIRVTDYRDKETGRRRVSWRVADPDLLQCLTSQSAKMEN